MSMDNAVAPKHSCQLETRHWVITDGEGETSIVNGPGVIGQFSCLLTMSLDSKWIKYLWITIGFMAAIIQLGVICMQGIADHVFGSWAT